MIAFKDLQVESLKGFTIGGFGIPASLLLIAPILPIVMMLYLLIHLRHATAVASREDEAKDVIRDFPWVPFFSGWTRIPSILAIIVLPALILFWAEWEWLKRFGSTIEYGDVVPISDYYFLLALPGLVAGVLGVAIAMSIYRFIAD